MIPYGWVIAAVIFALVIGYAIGADSKEPIQ